MDTKLIKQPLSSSPAPSRTIQGDPATHRFSRIFLITLAVITIGVIVGIAAGNIAHYRYSGPGVLTNASLELLRNGTFFQ